MFTLEQINARAECGLKMSLLSKRCLTDHRISYSPQQVGENEAGEFDQEWGQLMGSPISFPVLSILNAGINLYFVEKKRGRKYTDPSLVPIRVNGDDVIVGVDDPTGWSKLVSYVGLEPSVGKNYVSLDTAVINSEVYSRSRDIPDNMFLREWEKVSFLNIGLLYGDGRVHGTTSKRFQSEGCFDSVGQRAQSLVDCEFIDRESLMTAFIARNPEVFNSKQPWYLHEQLGGLGLPLTSHANIGVGHRKLAAYLAYLPRPDGAIASAASGSVELQSACKEWMTMNRRLTKHMGYEEHWDTYSLPYRSVDSLKLRFTHFLGNGSYGVESERSRSYERLYARAQSLPLKPLPIDECYSWVRRKTCTVNPRTTTI